MANPRVFLELAIDAESLGRIEIMLFADVTPKTAENFRCLCTGEKGRGESGKRLNFLGSKLHRVMPGLICGGDTTRGDGTGGESIYGHEFDDENFKLKHGRAGMVSMANSGPNTNGSQFLIITKSAPHLDGKNVVFGKVTSGMNVIAKLEEQCAADEEGKPSKKVIILDCGEIEQEEEPKAKKAKVTSSKAEKFDSSKVAHVLHILRKHKDLKKPTSWRQEKITCSKEEASEHLKNLRKQLEGKQKTPGLRKMFEELAKEHSDCKSAKKGGDLGPFERDMMQKPFEDASFALKPGELSEVISSKLGEHLILRIS
eukprot:TRINITY_DN80686_c0_g1_i1.p1 TRINITY_DN80686_c0_g1~~TRINITY_DN80686_c0_g1_i1.p1  ORF type:complete len:314 (+),score=65.72 TRINITY_DN80686_c0_g1_i1:82-1023(+)